MNEPKTTERNWLSFISHTFQFILGFLIGITLIAGGVVGAAYYYFTRVSSQVPEKPVYPEEANTTTVDRQPAVLENELQTNSETSSEVETPLEPITEDIPDGAYYANVTWSQGLSLRAEPSVNADRIGGVGYNARILILEDSADRQWQKVRLPESEREGWVKAGNTKRASD